ncbi:MAG: hypothetical protein J5525_14615 [Lachnospiraceae bacterium]|nr:hypothetical protein [Lachnospiraceae bacterium]
MKIKANLILILCSVMLMGCGMQQGKVYTTEDIVETCGLNERTRDFNMGGYDSVNLMSSKSTVDKHFEFMDFYIFESSHAAKKAFKRTESWYREIEEEGDDYRKGWLAGVCDADIEQYEYLTGNMIILVDMQCVSTWGEYVPEEDSEPDPQPDPDPESLKAYEEATKCWTMSYREEIIELMRETFN